MKLVASTDNSVRCVLSCFHLAVSSSRQTRLEPKCLSESLSLVEGSRISKYNRRNNQKFYRRHYFRLREDSIWKTPPRRGDLLSDFLSLIKCKLAQKSALRYSSPYLHITLSPSVFFVIEQILTGGSFYCSIARYPKLPNRQIAEIK